MQVFLERFVLAFLAAAFLVVAFTNPMKLDAVQRGALGVAIIALAALAAFAAHTLSKTRAAQKTPGPPPREAAAVHDAAPEARPKAAEKQDRVFVGESITPEYLIGIFREHTAIQGATLTAAYLGKWMKVSGSLGDVVSTTPNLAQLTFERAEVPFTERTWFDYTSFYMMFRRPWIDHLEIAKRGDKLTVIGQIERIDSVSVQLENCELVGSDSNLRRLT
jgi:hypothetical protein